MFIKSRDIDPSYVPAYMGLSWAYTHHFLLHKKPKDAAIVVASSEKAYELDPESALANMLKGITHHFKQEFDRAFLFYKKAIDINPNISEINFTIGVICRHLGLYNKAIKYFKRSRELNPFYIYSTAGLGGAYNNLGDFEKAKIYFDKVLEMNPYEPIVSFIYIRLNIMTGQLDKAEEMIDKLEKIDPGLDWLPSSRALLFAAKGEKEKALALDRNAEVYILLGMNDKAIEYIMKNMDDPGVYNYLGLISWPVYNNLRDDPRFKELIAKKKKMYEQRLKWSEGL